MALRHISTIFCDYLIRADDGRLTFAGTFRNLSWQNLPFIKQFSVAVEFIGEEGDPFHVSIVGNDINIVFAEGNIEIPQDLQPLQRWSTVVAGAMQLIVQQEGVYEVILRSGDDVIHRAPIGMIHLALPEAAEE